MNYATVCTGIGAPEVAWRDFGWNCVFQSEIEKFPNAVLKHHYPDVPNYGDMTKYKEWPDDRTIDLICAGTPCQAFSIAGLRKGLGDPRGNLTLVFLGILSKYKPRLVLWENVPGVLSEETGAFDSFIAGLQEIGYGVAWSVLDAQYFGLAQRRERVFVVGSLGDWRYPAAILFDLTSLCWYPAPSREAGQGFAADVAPSLTSSGRGVERTGESRGQDPVIARCLQSRHDGSEDGTGRGVPLVAHKIVGPLCADGGTEKKHGAGGLTSIQHMLSGYIQPVVMAHGQANAEVISDASPSLTCNHEAPICFAVAENQRGEIREMEKIPSLSKGGRKPGQGTPVIAIQSVNTPRNKKQNGVGISDEGVMYSCTARDQHGVAIAFKAGQGAGARSLGLAEELSPTLPSSDSGSNRAPTVCHTTGAGFWREGAGTLRARPQDSHENLVVSMQVRRLTPKECCRLQGFPDDYLGIQYRGKPAADGPKYKALGNSMAVPVVRWIGNRIRMLDEILGEKQ